MEMMVLDQDFIAIKTIDTYKSLIWTDRYFSAGEVEFYTPMDVELLQYLKKDNYLWQRNSEHLMIIERIEIESDVETGIYLIVNAKSLEYILHRRIIWNETTLNGTFADGIKRLVTESIVSPSISERRIDNFVYVDPTDEYILGLTLTDEYVDGENVYDTVQKLCEERKVGFKVTLNDQNQFVFELYRGTDRSYNQLKNPFVIFSPKFENMVSAQYFESNENARNVALVAGDTPEGQPRTTVTVGSTAGLMRREIWVNGSDVKSKDDNNNDIPRDQYLEGLRQKGENTLLEYQAVTSFTGESETTRMFRYGEHFFIGDIVQVEDGYGHDNEAYITELIFSQDDSGYTVYPTFEVVNEEEVGA